MKEFSLPKKLLVINDLSGVGRCSMSVALPVISACKVQACPLPTAIFSNHLGFATHYKKDLTRDMIPYLEYLSYLDVSFDGVYCGYLGNLEQMEIVTSFLSNSPYGKDLHMIIDPVMGDHGKPYRSITAEYCETMKSFIGCATLLTPNITEACILTDTPYQDAPFTLDKLQHICYKLQNLGAKKIVITGMKDHQFFYNYIYESSTDHLLVKTPIAGTSRPGTGDLFASILSALTLNGIALAPATHTASTFIATCTKASDELGIPTQEGVCFELFLEQLLH